MPALIDDIKASTSQHPREWGAHLVCWTAFIVALGAGSQNGIGWFQQPNQSLWVPLIHGAAWNAATFLLVGRWTTHTLQTGNWSSFLKFVALWSCLLLPAKSGLEWAYVQLFEPELRDVSVWGFAIENVYSLAAVAVLALLYFAVRRALGASATEERVLTLRSGQNTHRVPIDSIQFLKSEGNYVAFHADEGKVLALLTMDGALELTDDDRFLRVHRSYIVNTARIQTFGTGEVVIEGQTIPVGRTYRERLRELPNRSSSK